MTYMSSAGKSSYETFKTIMPRSQELMRLFPVFNAITMRLTKLVGRMKLGKCRSKLGRSRLFSKRRRSSDRRGKQLSRR